MVGSFRHKGLGELYWKGKTRKIGAEYLARCRSILAMLHAASHQAEMNVTGFRFQGLQGTPKRWSVHVTANYRVTFGWKGENAIDIDFEDYH